MSYREQANAIVEKIKKYQEDTDGWKPAKNSVSKKLTSSQLLAVSELDMTAFAVKVLDFLMGV